MDTVKFNSYNTRVIAHRGLSGIERENTVPAFVAAANRSYYGIETDVHVTKDGRFVVIHDDDTKRVTEGAVDLAVEQSEAKELTEIVLPDRDGTRIRSDIRIPTLEEYIAVCKKYDKVCVLELKNHFNVDDIVRMIESIDAQGYLCGMIFISFNYENCVNLRKLLPDATIQWLVGSIELSEEEIISRLLEYRLDIDVFHRRIGEHTIERLHEKGIRVNTWTVDDKECAEALAKGGVDYITTNILE